MELYNISSINLGGRKNNQASRREFLGRRQRWERLPADDVRLVLGVQFRSCRGQKARPSRGFRNGQIGTDHSACLGPHRYSCHRMRNLRFSSFLTDCTRYFVLSQNFSFGTYVCSIGKIWLWSSELINVWRWLSIRSVIIIFYIQFSGFILYIVFLHIFF